MVENRARMIRWGSVMIMSVLIVIVLLDTLREIVPYWDVLLAVGLLVTWMLGQRYERALIIEAGLADEDDIRRVERESSGWLL